MTLNNNEKILNKKTSKILTAGIVGATAISCITSISHADQRTNYRETKNISLVTAIFGLSKEEINEDKAERKEPGLASAIIGGFIQDSNSSNNEYEEIENQKPGVLDAVFGSFKTGKRTVNNYSQRGGQSRNRNVNQQVETISEINAKKIPLMLQTDPQWSSLSYGSSTIGKGGCGPTSVAMVVSALTGETVLPPEVSEWAAPNHRAPSGGSSWSLFPAAGEKWGLKVVNISKKNPEKIKEHLRSGNPIIVSMSKGNFTRGGHIMVLAGIDSNDKVIVRDPNSKERSELKWDFSIIMNECSKNGEAPFFAFSK